MPETTKSAAKSCTRPRLAKRTQSTGVPSEAYPTVPSENGTSVTHRGLRVVIDLAIAERLPSGAITARRTSSTRLSARRIDCRPSASIPSSLVKSTFSIQRPA